MAKENLVNVKEFRMFKRCHEILQELSEFSGFSQAHIKQMLLQQELLKIKVFAAKFGGLENIDYSLGILNLNGIK